VTNVGVGGVTNGQDHEVTNGQGHEVTNAAPVRPGCAAVRNVSMSSHRQEAAMSTARSEVEREIGADGAFTRQANRFTTTFGDGPDQAPVAPGRYRLIVSPVCPWAHRALIVRRLLGLENAISLGVTNPLRTPQGWEFSDDPDGVDPVLGIRFLNQAYEATDPQYAGRATVPAVIDESSGHVVTNDYHRLTNELETGWAPLHAPGAPDLYPQHLRNDIDALNRILFEDVNNGVYRCGFARSQAAYEQAFDQVFDRLDDLESRLLGQRYLFGDRITDSDVRLFVTLVRFDVAYHGLFKVNRNRLVDYPALWGYARDLYATPGFGDTTSFDGIKRGYYLGAAFDNPHAILPKGPDLSGWTEPHGREWLNA
jgi:putative glutathione S-transferase